MPTTTPDRARVVEGLVAALCHSRAALPHAANGAPIAPSDPYVADLLRDIAAGRKKPLDMLLAITECNLRDGASLADATAWLRDLLAHAQVYATTCTRRSALERPIETLVRSETRAQFKADDAQHAVLVTPECPEALDRAARRAQAHADELLTFATACRAKRAAVLIRTPRRTMQRSAAQMMVTR